MQLSQQGDSDNNGGDGLRSRAARSLQGVCAAAGPTALLVLASSASAPIERVACIQLLLLAFRVATDVDKISGTPTAQHGMMGVLLVAFVRVVQSGVSGNTQLKQLETTLYTAVLGLLQVARDVFKEQVRSVYRGLIVNVAVVSVLFTTCLLTDE